MSEKLKPNYYNNPAIREAANKMETADPEAAQKEKEYQAEQNVWWRKILKKIRSSEGGPQPAQEASVIQKAPVVLEEVVKDKRMWDHLVVGIDELKALIDAGENIVFSGGASNYIDEDGNLKRNAGRDKINSKLNQLKKYFFDPQIDAETHGRGYDSKQDSIVEKEALKVAEKPIFEINDRSLGGVTMLEIVRHMQKKDSGRIVLFNTNNQENLSFKPLGLENPDADKKENATKAHKKELFKAMNNMRREVVAMLTLDGLVKSENNQNGNVVIVYGENSVQSDNGAEVIEITADKPHLVDLLRAYHQATQKNNVVIHFSGEQRDAEGNFAISPEVAGASFDEYVAQGKEMRDMLKTYLGDDSSSEIASSEEEVVEMIATTQIKPDDSKDPKGNEWQPWKA